MYLIQVYSPSMDYEACRYEDGTLVGCCTDHDGWLSIAHAETRELAQRILARLLERQDSGRHEEDYRIV